MPRLRSKASGVVVNVSDETAALLAHRFEAVEVEKKPAPKKAAAKSDSK